MTTLADKPFINSLIFTVPGNWTAPDVCTEIYILGSGGAGGGGSGAPVGRSGGAGGNTVGAWQRTNVDPGAVYSITIGVGGNGGNAPNGSGSNGGDTSIVGGSVNIVFPGASGAPSSIPNGGFSANGIHRGRSGLVAPSNPVVPGGASLSLYNFTLQNILLSGGSGGQTASPSGSPGNGAGDTNGGSGGAASGVNGGGGGGAGGFMVIYWNE